MGILPGWGGTVRLPRSMPVFRAREIIYSGRKDYTAREMYEMGLLTRVFPDDVFEPEFQRVIDNLGQKKPIALRMAKEIMDKAIDGTSLETALSVERHGITWLVYAPDIQALLDQFSQSTDKTNAKR
jgi:enoyl-CoA hydratase/carnithine racemase